ncbi:MAG: Arc family DNA binding domain-containing protein [Planctomycetes bacterium]|nr:Arc family DNA binding domain-containing protein [Planctomycetota bacterium]
MSEKKTLLLRLSPDLWAEVKRFADAELRSVNGQIEYILREAVRKRAGKTSNDLGGDADAGDSDSQQ